MPFLTLESALNRAKERSGATSADDEFLTEILELSAGKDALGQTHYRPYYCGAKWLEQNLSAQTLIEDDGTKFTGLAKPIASLLNFQAAYDAAQGLTVPDGFEAIATGQSQGFRIQGTRSYNPTLRP